MIPYAGQSENRQHQSAKRGREGEDEPQARSTRFVTAPDNLLQVCFKQVTANEADLCDRRAKSRKLNWPFANRLRKSTGGRSTI